MNKYTERLLFEHLDINLARLKGLGAMILALIASRSIQLSAMARFFPASSNHDTAFKRLQRLIKEVVLPSDKIALIVMAILGFKSYEKMTLILDRTNWKFGRTHLNFLFLAISHKGVAIPIFFTLLKDKKNGNSNYLDRIEVIEKFISLLGKSRINFIIGDREFIGKEWVIWLRKMRIPFIMRLSEKTTKIAIRDDNFINTNELFSGLKKGKKRFLNYCLIGETDSYKACISVLKTYDNELVVLVHSDDINNPFPYYLERWRIESMFRVMKTGGFNIESTHVTDPQRLTTLLSVMIIAFCLALKAGKIANNENKIKEKKMVTLS